MPSDTPHQKRIILYSFDRGTGIGHLRKISHIARALQGPAACLIVTCHRKAANFLVPEECEYVHLPSWDSLMADRAKLWGRDPFLQTDRQDALHLRKSILNGVVKGFRPDAILVDHIPLGGDGELADILENTACKKYLMTRGVQNETEDLAGLIFGGKAKDALTHSYDAILANVDQKVFDFSEVYDLGPAITGKTHHLGYINDPISPITIEQTRLSRGASATSPWIVASAGGGQNGEALVQACMTLVDHFPTALIDITLGPRSRLKPSDFEDVVAKHPCLRVHAVSENLPVMNASADVTVTGGGYNSLMEALSGSAHIICVPLRPSQRDEQYKNAKLLAKYVDIGVSTNPDDLPRLVENALLKKQRGRQPDRRSELNLDGIAATSKWILDDLATPHPLQSAAGQGI